MTGCWIFPDTAPNSPPGPPETERAHRLLPRNTWPRLARGLFHARLDAGTAEREDVVALFVGRRANLLAAPVRLIPQLNWSAANLARPFLTLPLRRRSESLSAAGTAQNPRSDHRPTGQRSPAGNVGVPYRPDRGEWAEMSCTPARPAGGRRLRTRVSEVRAHGNSDYRTRAARRPSSRSSAAARQRSIVFSCSSMLLIASVRFAPRIDGLLRFCISAFSCLVSK